jgi:hypothetical protein
LTHLLTKTTLKEEYKSLTALAFLSTDWFYFTIWNINLITIYFFVASTASIVGTLKRTPFDEVPSKDWRKFEMSLGIAVQILFSIAVPTATFVTIFYYVFLSGEGMFDMWNISYHLLNTLLLVVDMILNSVVFRWEHLLFTLSWFFLYIIYAWGMVSGA